MLCGLCLIGLLALASQDGPSDRVVALRRCAVEYERSSMLSVGSIGIIQELPVRPGESVKAGQVLGRLQDHEAKAALELRRTESESDVKVRIEEARHRQSLTKLRTDESLRKRGFVSVEDHELKKGEAETQALEVEGARHERRLALLQRQQVEAAIRAREITSPFDGVVAGVFKGPGESVAPNDPVIRVVDLARLRVTGHLDVADSWRVQPGQRVRFAPEVPGTDLPIERERFEGQVVFIEPQVAAETQTVRVVAEVANRNGLLRAGLEGRLEIWLVTPGAEPSTAPRP